MVVDTVLFDLQSQSALSLAESTVWLLAVAPWDLCSWCKISCLMFHCERTSELCGLWHKFKGTTTWCDVSRPTFLPRIWNCSNIPSLDKRIHYRSSSVFCLSLKDWTVIHHWAQCHWLSVKLALGFMDRLHNICGSFNSIFGLQVTEVILTIT